MKDHTPDSEAEDANSITGVYIGSENMEAYGIIPTIEKDIEVKWNAVVETVSNNLIRAAMRKAYQVSEGSMPKCEDGTVTFCLRISLPKEGKHFTEKMPPIHLPDAAKTLALTAKPDVPYTIIVIKTNWTARWLCLPPGGIEGLAQDGVTPSTGITFLGKVGFDFGCPHPSKHGVVTKEYSENFDPLRRGANIANFRAGFKNHIDSISRQVKETTLMNLETAILQLAKCPPECKPGDLSITLGYPQSFEVQGLETETGTVPKNDYVIENGRHVIVDGQYKMVTVQIPMYNYKVMGMWSWTVQRACGGK